jgi:hypothetical protein
MTEDITQLAQRLGISLSAKVGKSPVQNLAPEVE